MKFSELTLEQMEQEAAALGMPLDPKVALFEAEAQELAKVLYGINGVVSKQNTQGYTFRTNGDVSLFAGVKVGEGATVRDSIIMRGACIGAGAVVERAVIAEMLW